LAPTQGDTVIELRYPGVFVVELATHPTPIEGVPTASTGADALQQAALDSGTARLPAATPEWTDANPGDPGITLLEILAYTLDALGHRPGVAARSCQSGVVTGLGVDGGMSAQVHVSPGLGLKANGCSMDPNATAARWDAAKVKGEHLISSGSFPSKCEGPDLAASANDVAIEPVELGNEGFVGDGDDASSRDGEPD
jgi:hypothetical protein